MSVLLVAVASLSVDAQERRVEIDIEAGPNHLVSPPRPTMRRDEVWLAASRKDPKVFVAVYHGDITNTRTTGCESVISNDGGQSWRRFNLPEETDCFDPMVVSGANGQFYISYSAWRAPAPEFSLARGNNAPISSSAPIKTYASLDDGKTWSEPVNLITPFRPDHQRQAVDLSGGRFDGRVYVSWVEFPAPTLPGTYHLFLHYLDAAGQTQSKPRLVHATDEARPVSLEPLVLSDGTLLLPIYYQRVSNWGDPTSEGPTVYVTRSSDGGETFGPLEKVIEIGSHVWRPRMHRFSQLSPLIFAVDDHKSSPHRDRLYAVWTDTRAGATSDIWLIWSANQGRTWSAPVRVNDFAAPEKETEPPDVRMLPVVAVNKDGVVGVAWYDRREDPTRRCAKQYFSASLDGGRTFLPNRAISTAPSCPTPTRPPAVEVYNERVQELPSWE